MKPRESLLIAGAALVLLTAGLVVLGGRDPALAGRSDASDAVPHSPVPESPELDAPVRPADPVALDLGEPEFRAADARADGTPRTHGAIDGRILLASDVVGRIRECSILVEEQANTNAHTDGDRKPFRRFYPCDVSPRRTPRFFIDDIPFSAYGYRVAAHVPGLNGSGQTVRITEASPLQEVVLAITAGAPFTVRLIDQFRNPWTETKVELSPFGEPHGRRRYAADTNRFGTAVFEDVLAGHYQVRVGERTLREVQVHPKEVQVQSSSPIAEMSAAGVQSVILEMATGTSLRVEVAGPAGYGIEGVEIEMFAVDTVQNIRLEGKTDRNGTCTFEHVVEGRYHLNLAAERFHRTSKTIRVPDPDGTGTVSIRLAPK